MEVPTYSPKRPPLEVRELELYSIGARGNVLTNRFYKSMNRTFGVKMVVQNNTAEDQLLKISCCVYDTRDQDETLIKWGTTRKVKPYNKLTKEFNIHEEEFSRLREGNYKIQFWINGKRVMKKFFTIAYK